MLAIFRSNQVTTAIPLALYVALTHAAALLGWVSPNAEDAAAGSTLAYRALFGWAANNAFFSALGAAILVYVQALIVNRLADQFRLLGERNWIPGMCYVLVAACLPDFLFLSPALVAVTFVAVVARHIFRAYKIPRATTQVFDAAFWTVVSSLFYPPAIWLLLAAYAGVNIVRSFSLREQCAFLAGMAIPFFLGWLLWFWADQGDVFRQEQCSDLFQFYAFRGQLTEAIWLKWGILATFLLMVLFNLGNYSARKGIDVQKFISVLLWMMMVGVGSILLQRDPSRTHFLLAAVAIGIFLSMTLSSWRNRFVAEILHLVLLGLVIFGQIF